jgi:alpha-beta hydrolase superfamily lysophospholipase
MAAPTYGFKSDELEAKLSENNPIERVGVLAKAKVPVFIIRGDGDKVVPLKENSAELAARYEAAGAKDAVTLVLWPRARATTSGKASFVVPNWFSLRLPGAAVP